MMKLFSKKNTIFNLRQLLSLVVSLAFFTSCVSTKNITYFQGNDTLDTAKYSTLKKITPPVPKIQVDDILAVTVSSLSAESNEVFNFPNITPIPITNFPGGSGAGSRTEPMGYSVLPDGNVEMPLIGKIKVIGLTLEEAGVLIKQKLVTYLKEPSVNLRFLNLKFTVIGEVSRPGIYNLLDNHTTLLEALGTAGDLTVYGRRDNVMLIRTQNEEREIVKLDLNKRDVLDSPYYYIRNNDFIYVEPTQGKVTSSDRTLQLIPIVTGVTTTFVLLLSLLFK